MARSEKHRTIAQHRKARYLYEILEELECGLVLQGTEVKSLRAGQASIAESYASSRNGELWLVGATIPVYSHGSAHNHEPDRERKLLASKKQIDDWYKKAREKGITMVPLELYFEGHLVKVKLGLVRGKRQQDKRQAARQRSDQREMDRALRRRR
ncbi:MAG: SsrA-binding protein SmpB [Planctomycetota bacterium]|jgi:SsrA-binding protein|nr:SsrA-binding protein [Planctomycetota bacterium]MDP6368853.1 SsrA-binding protein SmpB [Planctomycetota bacterium]MDP6839643.1 SsrA-binding protein SmpB [Planctomycetota bacterium]MDP6956116.1 SsrA-binding protein SmpB [Planctomycetota bacterium]